MLVRDVMTRRPVTVPVTGTVADALATAEKADVHHLLLTSKDEFAGVLCVCALRELDRTETLLSRLPHRIVAVQAESPVWIAQRRFDEQEVSCMPVFEGDDLVEAGAENAEEGAGAPMVNSASHAVPSAARHAPCAPIRCTVIFRPACPARIAAAARWSSTKALRTERTRSDFATVLRSYVTTARPVVIAPACTFLGTTADR